MFGGGSVLTANPEPLADFFDLILLGDGENLLDSFKMLIKKLEKLTAALSYVI